MTVIQLNVWWVPLSQVIKTFRFNFSVPIRQKSSFNVPYKHLKLFFLINIQLLTQHGVEWILNDSHSVDLCLAVNTTGDRLAPDLTLYVAEMLPNTQIKSKGDKTLIDGVRSHKLYMLQLMHFNAEQLYTVFRFRVIRQVYFLQQIYLNTISGCMYCVSLSHKDKNVWLINLLTSQLIDSFVWILTTSEIEY